MELRGGWSRILSSGLLLAMSLRAVYAQQSDECEMRVAEAVIGRELTLTCNIMNCFTTSYTWYRLENGEWMRDISETSNHLTVSQNVTSAAEVGGHEYICNCSDSAECQRFKIGVKPVATLFTSQPVVKTGAAATVKCLGESYPEANDLKNYLIEHPKNFDISAVLLKTGGGVVHVIEKANKSDDGEYDCIVTVTYGDTPLQSDTDTINLIVYDPPKISDSRNYTISEPAGQQAILECTVFNGEGDELDVWVDWYNANTKSLVTEEHVAFNIGDVYYLLLYNASAGDFECQVFSNYSSSVPEDKKTVSIIMKGSPTSTPSTGGNTSEEGKDYHSIVVGLAVPLVLLVIITLVSVLVGVVIYVIRKNRHKKDYSPTAAENSDHDQIHSESNQYVDFTNLPQRTPSLDIPTDVELDLKKRDSRPTDVSVEYVEQQSQGQIKLQELDDNIQTPLANTAKADSSKLLTNKTTAKELEDQPPISKPQPTPNSNDTPNERDDASIKEDGKAMGRETAGDDGGGSGGRGAPGNGKNRVQEAKNQGKKPQNQPSSSLSSVPNKLKRRLSAGSLERSHNRGSFLAEYRRLPSFSPKTEEDEEQSVGLITPAGDPVKPLFGIHSGEEEKEEEDESDHTT